MHVVETLIFEVYRRAVETEITTVLQEREDNVLVPCFLPGLYA